MATSEQYCSTNLAVMYGTYFRVEGNVKRKNNGEIEFTNIKAVVEAPQYLQVNLTIYVWYTSNMSATASTSTDGKGTYLSSDWKTAKSSAITLNNYNDGNVTNKDEQSLGSFTVNPGTTGPVKVAFGYWASSYYDVNLGTGSNRYNVGEASEFFKDGGLVVPYKPVSGLKMSSSDIGTNSFKISSSWSAGIDSDGRVYVTANGKTKLIDDDPVTFTSSDGISSNTYYTVSGRLCDATHTDDTFESGSLNLWTKPIINTPTLSRRSSSESNIIDVSVSANVASNYDQFAYKLGNGSWSGWTTSKTHSYTGLSENTTYTVYVKMKNTSSGYESAEKSASITTWYNPVSNLKVVLVNRWYWYIAIKSSYTYNGSISKFEFAVGNDQAWQNKGTTNSHSRGSTTPGASGNLAYNTTYTCWVRLTDNHGRTYQTTADFTTLDERPLYVDGTLREVKVIKPDGSITYITPNLLSVIKSDSTVINMNKIINNDSRTKYE